MKKQMIAIVLAVALLSGQAALADGFDEPVFTETTEEVFEEETSEMSDDAAGIEQENIETATEDETIFDEVEISDSAFDEGEEVLIEEVSEINPATADSGECDFESAIMFESFELGERIYYETKEECVQALLDGMTQRESLINLYYVGDDYTTGFSKMLQDTAVRHDLTLSSDTGDYLRYHYHSVTRRTYQGTINGKIYYRFEYEFSYLSSREQEIETTLKVEEIMNNLQLSGSVYEKTKMIYDYVTANVLYDSSGEEYNAHSAYAAAVKQRAVCQGFATLTYRLLRESGVDCRIVGGHAGSVNHAWLMVHMDDVWYFIDPTWDAGYSPKTWHYFLIGGDDFLKEHIWENQYQTDPLFETYVISKTNYLRPEPESETETEPETEPEPKPADPETLTVGSLYEHILHRKPDPEGEAYWKHAIASGEKDGIDLICGFVNSQEFLEKGPQETRNVMRELLYDEVFIENLPVAIETEKFMTVSDCYTDVLGRTPESDGMHDWYEGMTKNQKSEKEVYYGFFFSPELISKAVDNETFIDLMYRNIFHREPDLFGRIAWNMALTAGMTREEAFERFTESEEYKNIYGL